MRLAHQRDDLRIVRHIARAGTDIGQELDVSLGAFDRRIGKARHMPANFGGVFTHILQHARMACPTIAPQARIARSSPVRSSGHMGA